QQIRLVRIIPSRGSSPIRCEFVLSMVDNHKKPYTALSYIWGPARERSDVVKIQLHDQDFWIRRNLWDFLQRARMDRSLCAKLFWIDAICIDQAGNGSNGLLEKNHQVNMMAEIYSNAHEVICWLGE
ncbi:heterokaryon incompatibility protein-domain-containing protein, partial [Pyrenochaeta sp. MPI-SDFR-AT-0127]